MEEDTNGTVLNKARGYRAGIVAAAEIKRSAIPLALPSS
jgi:hypothetical protein